MSGNNKINKHSISDNEEAVKLYTLGMKEIENENIDKAIEYFEKALIIDQKFSFAWDNLGVCYRMKNDYDNAIRAYEKSLAIDPNGITPLQNIAVVYLYKKDYTKAIESYQKLKNLDKNNPEIYYGIGNTYATMKEYEKGLDYMCKAYNLYIEQNSPLRTDAENIISYIYTELKEQGKEEIFTKILKENHITVDE